MFDLVTKVHLLSNVPFNSYKNVRMFNNTSEQITFFSKYVEKELEEQKYQRVDSNEIKVNYNAVEIANVNYIRFQNTKYGDKWFYAFVRKIDYISKNVSRVIYELDIFQTWLFDFTFKTSYIEREHSTRYIDSKPVINTLDEGLDYGSAYKIIKEDSYKSNNQDVIFLVLVLKRSPSLKMPNVSKISNSLFVTFFPIYIGSRANYPTFYVKYDGTSTSFLVRDGAEVINILTTDEDFVNTIANAYMIDDLPIDYDLVYSSSNNTINITMSNTQFNIDSYYFSKAGQTIDFPYLTSRFTLKTTTIATNKYSNFPSYEESKLLMYPYSLIEITDNRGGNFIIKAEDITGDSLIIRKAVMLGNIPKIAYLVGNYNSSLNLIDYGFINIETNDVPVLDDYTASYLQANKNTLNTSEQHAIDNANRNIKQNNTLNQFKNDNIEYQRSMSGMDTFNDIIGSASRGDLGGILNSGVNASRRSYDLQYEQSVGNLNNSFANNNLKINAEQQIAINQAKLQDINNIPPTLSGLGNNAYFDFAFNYYGLFVRYKTVKDEYATRLINYFKMFGYKVNKIGIPKLKTRTSYNYIKTTDCHITGNIPGIHLEVLKSIFNEGVTLWHTDDISNYNLENKEV